MVDVYIQKIEPIREKLSYTGGSFLLIVKFEVTATVHIEGIGITTIERGVYEFEKEKMPDRISKIEEKIASLYENELEG